jgi:hypothetical protein
VITDGRTIFSKGDVGRFPLEGEVGAKFAELRPAK